MRKLYVAFPKVQTLSELLSWSHYVEILKGDNPPIGIVLGAYKDEVLVKYATSGLTNQLFVSKYQLYLPDETSLRQEVQRIIEQE